MWWPICNHITQRLHQIWFTTTPHLSSFRQPLPLNPATAFLSIPCCCHLSPNNPTNFNPQFHFNIWKPQVHNTLTNIIYEQDVFGSILQQLHNDLNPYKHSWNNLSISYRYIERTILKIYARVVWIYWLYNSTDGGWIDYFATHCLFFEGNFGVFKRLRWQKMQLQSNEYMLDTPRRLWEDLYWAVIWNW